MRASRRVGVRVRVRVAALAAAAVALSACSGQLPTTPEPRPGFPVSVQAPRNVNIFLTPPQPGAEPGDIVRGFLRANRGFADDQDVARRYLTEGLASEWVPTREVLVYESSPEVALTETGQVAVTVQVAGRIDAEGRLAEQTTGTTTTQTFSLTQVDGEWRISGFPESFGVWLSRSELQQAFRPTTLYYLNPHGSYFVPEVRWLALGEGRPTAVARAQLAPLPDYLQGAVRTAASEDVRLSFPSVPVDPATHVATVALQGSGLVAGTDPTVALQSQLAHALLGLSGVVGVDVQVAGQSLPLGESDGPITTSTELPYGDLVRDVDVLLLRVGETFTPVEPDLYALRNLPAEQAAGLELPRLGLSWTGVAASADLRDFAAVSNDRTVLLRWQEGETHRNAGIGDGLTAPAVDPHGAFWVAGIHRSSSMPWVWVIDRADLRATARPIDVPWLRERDRVRSMSISPDGSRVVMVIGDTTNERRRLVMAGVVRDGEGRATALTEGVPVAASLVDIASARWAAVGDLYLVGRRQEDPRPRAYSLRLGEWLTPIGSADSLSPVDLVAVPDGAGARPVARTADGRFHTPEGSQGWFDARNGDQLVVPGS